MNPPPYQEKLISRPPAPKTPTAFERVAAIEPRALLIVFAIGSIFFNYFHYAPNILYGITSSLQVFVGSVFYGILLYTAVTNKSWALELSRNLACSFFILHTIVLALTVSVIVYSTAQRISDGEFKLIELMRSSGYIVFNFRDVRVTFCLFGTLGELFWNMIWNVLVTDVMLVVEAERTRRQATIV